MSREDPRQSDFTLSDLITQHDFNDSSVCILMPSVLMPLTMTALGSEGSVTYLEIVYKILHMICVVC